MPPLPALMRVLSSTTSPPRPPPPAPPPAAYYFTRSILLCIRTLEGKDTSPYDTEWKGWVLTGFFFLNAWLLGGWQGAAEGLCVQGGGLPSKLCGSCHGVMQPCLATHRPVHLPACPPARAPCPAPAHQRTRPALPLPALQASRCNAWPLAA